MARKTVSTLACSPGHGAPSQPLHQVVVVYFDSGFIEGGGSFTILPAGCPILSVSSSDDFIFTPITASTLLATCQGKRSQHCSGHISSSSNLGAIRRTSLSGASLRAVVV